MRGRELVEFVYDAADRAEAGAASWDLERLLVARAWANKLVARAARSGWGGGLLHAVERIDCAINNALVEAGS